MDISLTKLGTFIVFLTFTFALTAQPDRAYISELKEDIRGPYKDIKWFCSNGSIREARDPCPEPLEGVQHARYKDKVASFASRHHIYLDQILTGTDFSDFWDDSHQQSRLKQYQITNFLFEADNGWVLEKAKNYRGAKQIEDEMKWGQEFLEWVVDNDRRLEENFLLIRLAAEDIPHGEDNRVSQKVRAYSKLLADVHSGFMNLRIKIHNNPSKDDIPLVKKWIEENNGKLNTTSRQYAEELIENMEILYTPFDLEEVKNYSRYLPEDSELRGTIENFVPQTEGAETPLRVSNICQLLYTIRQRIYDTRWRVARVKMIDLSNLLEDVLIQELSEYPLQNLADVRDQICELSYAIYGCGYIEKWEFDKVTDDLDWMYGGSVSLIYLDDYKFATQKLVQWSTQMIQSLYAEPMHEFHKFEPLVDGFTDDKIRSSIILPLGRTIEQLNELFNSVSKSPSAVMGKKNIGGLQGLNPGLAKGELVVIQKLEEEADLDPSKIYAFDRPPADLKPIAGILNVKEGNPVSHVQLLARNLGIPNALIPSDVLSGLSDYTGKEVFYAVSPKGTVLLKEAEDMSKEEERLFQSDNRAQKRITISTKKIILDPDKLLDLSDLDASYSGKWCGPKAANLGQLKKMFPQHVVDGFVIPFGVFKDHMMQDIPGIGESYWTYLNRIFVNERAMLRDNTDLDEVQCVTLQELGLLRKHIEEMPLRQNLIANIETHFINTLNGYIGSVPVFLRSDTNMEDLPEFTGAGLNLTLFNVVDRNEILNGIKKVWASPYTERSYQWRQQYLENPEEVYPSILIIPSVNVDKSGVIITKGVSRGDKNDLSISFSRGVGGAVDGQSAETYIIYENGKTELISPGRETKYRVIPPGGGSTIGQATLTNPVLTANDRRKLKKMAEKISEKMDKVSGSQGPYDIELGIKDGKIWLFQVRPFVENKSALGSDYLKSLDPSYEDIHLVLDQRPKN